jgi:pyrimidine-nucleoside phosphorylase
MLRIGNRARDLDEGRGLAEAALADGSAFEKFRKLVEVQGGDVSYVDKPEQLPRATLIEPVQSPRGGWLAQVDARAIGEAAVALGAGRAKKTDAIDHAVGLVIHRKVGELVESGTPLFTVHSNDRQKLADAQRRVLAAHVIVDEPTPPLPLFYN